MGFAALYLILRADARKDRSHTNQANFQTCSQYTLVKRARIGQPWMQGMDTLDLSPGQTSSIFPHRTITHLTLWAAT